MYTGVYNYASQEDAYNQDFSREIKLSAATCRYMRRGGEEIQRS